MKDWLEITTLFFKMIALGAAALMFAALLLKPQWVAAHLERMEDGLSETNHRMEISFFGTKIFRDGRVNEDLVSAQEKIVTLEKLITCLKDGGAACTETQTTAAANISVKLTNSEPASPADVPPVDTWMVLAASFPSQKQAEDFNAQLAAYETDVILAQSRYRPIATFPTKEEANAALADIRNLTGRDDPYLRLLGAWCATYLRAEAGFIDCTR